MPFVGKCNGRGGKQADRYSPDAACAVVRKAARSIYYRLLPYLPFPSRMASPRRSWEQLSSRSHAHRSPRTFNAKVAALSHFSSSHRRLSPPYSRGVENKWARLGRGVRLTNALDVRAIATVLCRDNEYAVLFVSSADPTRWSHCVSCRLLACGPRCSRRLVRS